MENISTNPLDYYVGAIVILAYFGPLVILFSMEKCVHMSARKGNGFHKSQYFNSTAKTAVTFSQELNYELSCFFCHLVYRSLPAAQSTLFISLFDIGYPHQSKVLTMKPYVRYI
ncbi:unnamed protein product, partial [Onchocerca flexuosa]|uniref:DUF1360 domain-containing protein n=1 Tax=Onchocerca flexuosa TaxID=387005 RepID=A0A183I688_9BILA